MKIQIQMETKKNFKVPIIIGAVSFLLGVLVMGVCWYMDSKSTAIKHKNTLKQLSDSIETRFAEIKNKLEQKTE